MDNIWEKSLFLIREKVSNHNFDTWIKPLKLFSMDDERVEIEVPNKFFQDWLNDNYSDLIAEIVKEVSDKDLSVTFKVKKEAGRHVRSKERPEEDKKSDTEEGKKDSIPFASKYSFQNFVIGPSNQFAMAACQAVGNNPGKTYNPLFLYGGVGLGKTHLLHAIGNHVLSKKGKTKVLYVSSEKFTSEVVNAIRFDKVSSFRERYRGIDILLIDDVQFLAGKERTQEEFFHTFNSLFESHRQIVITSDSFPKEIRKIDERLRSRFEWGLIADIQPPELETRVAILKKKADLNSFFLPDDVAFYIASNYKSNIRELEGALIRIGAFSSLIGQDVSLNMAKDVLKVNEENRVISIDDIQKTVATHYNIKVSDLKSQRKLRNIAVPRQIAMYLSRVLTNASFPEIGREFGNKDHSTVIYAFKKIEKDTVGDSSFKKVVDNLYKKLKN